MLNDVLSPTWTPLVVTPVEGLDRRFLNLLRLLSLDSGQPAQQCCVNSYTISIATSQS